MEVSMLDAAGQALLIIMDPHRLLFLFAGVVLGLVLGILPGIGGLAGTALLLPFTFHMDPYTAFAFLLGLGATTATGDPIPAILFGVPGGAGSAATVLDGLPLTRKGQGGRALSAAYMSSLMGGLFGAALLAVSIPLLRPIMLYIGSPELLAFALFGLSTVAVLSGRAPLRGFAMGCFGILLAMIGSDPQSGTMRWTFGTLYLFDGLPLVPLILGIFALPELCDLAVARTSIAATGAYDIKSGMLQGARDCFRHWWLVLRCSWIGAALGSVPGIGGSVIDWLAYGHAIRTEKGAKESFGKGDIRGVIASESANNAKEGGALVPTVAFGVPGSASMTILLGAFLIHGLVPGPDMLTKNLDFTYTLVWSVAIANILGAGLCYLFSGQFARVATLRYTLVLPTVLGVVYIGAFEGSRQWGDLYSLLFFGVLGWTMKQLRWPRAPLVLGFVLGDIVERYTFVSMGAYGPAFLFRPVVLLLLAAAAISLARPLWADYRARKKDGHVRTARRLRFDPTVLFHAFMIGLIAVMVVEASGWSFSARIVPLIVGLPAILFILTAAIPQLWPAHHKPASRGDKADDRFGHMDIVSETGHLDRATILLRAGLFFAWLVAFMLSMSAIGLIPTVFLFVLAYMRLEGRERWTLVLPQAIALTLFMYVVFDRLLAIPWPPTMLGEYIPALNAIPSV